MEHNSCAKKISKLVSAFFCVGCFLLFFSFNAAATCTLTAKITSHKNILCNGDSSGSATVTPSGGVKPYTYLWSPLGGNGATANNLPAGLYIVTVTDSNGCIAKDSVNILQPAALNVNIVPTPATCGKNNGSATASASGGQAPYKYSWAPTGDTTATITNLSPGVYTCTVTDSNGCKAINSTVITGTGGPAVNVTQTADNGSCNGSATANITGGTAPYTYQWSPGGGTTAIINNLCTGTYCCTVTDAAGCQDTSCTTIATVTGLRNFSITGGISIYPVPASEILYIKANRTEVNISTIEVFDITGRRMLSYTIPGNIQTYKLDVSGLKKGIYLLKLSGDSGDRITRFSIVR